MGRWDEESDENKMKREYDNGAIAILEAIIRQERKRGRSEVSLRDLEILISRIIEGMGKW